jgi:hypothetical protein
LSLHPQVSTIYNKAIATSNTEIIVNAVIILFVMEMDERIFSALTAWNERWTAHAADRTIDEMKEELRKLHEIVQNMQESQVQYIYKSHKFRGNRSRLNRARMLREIAQKIPAATTTTTSDSDSECMGDTNARQMERVDEITMPSEAAQNIQDPQVAASTPASERDGDTDEDSQQ